MTRTLLPDHLVEDPEQTRINGERIDAVISAFTEVALPDLISVKNAELKEVLDSEVGDEDKNQIIKGECLRQISGAVSNWIDHFYDAFENNEGKELSLSDDFLIEGDERGRKDVMDALRYHGLELPEEKALELVRQFGKKVLAENTSLPFSMRLVERDGKVFVTRQTS